MVSGGNILHPFTYSYSLIFYNVKNSKLVTKNYKYTTADRHRVIIMQIVVKTWLLC